VSRNTDIFVSADEPLEEVMSVVEQALGRRFIHEEGSAPYIRIDPDSVYLGRHEFGDDDITWPDGSPVPLQSLYQHWIEVRDTEGDQQRQEELAKKIFEALRAHGQWKAVLIDDMQRIVDSYDPDGSRGSH
jgi:hypothetical protein